MQIEQLSAWKDIWGIVEVDSGIIHYSGSKVQVLTFFLGMIGPYPEA